MAGDPVRPPVDATTRHLCKLCTGLRDHQSVPQRLDTLVAAALVIDGLLAAAGVTSHSGAHCNQGEMRSLEVARAHVEDFRIRHHWSASATPLVESEGVTEDVCYYFVVCACDYLLWRGSQGGDAGAATPPQGGAQLHHMGCVPISGVPVCDFTATEVDCCYAALFIYEQDVDWRDRRVHAYISALQRRSSVLLLEHTTGRAPLARFAEHRAQWSCATARLKTKALRVREACTTCAPPAQCHDVPAAPAAVVTLDKFWQWTLKTIAGWDGPRLREAVARGYHRRVLRADEIGKNVACAGQWPICRARGALDATEEVLHLLDLAAIATVEDVHAHGIVRTLRDVVLMKLIDNALSPQGVCFLAQHVLLDSAREAWRSTSTPPSVLHIVEIAGSFVVRGHQTRQGTHGGGATTTPVSFPTVFVRWYVQFFGEEDPLGLRC